MDTETETEIWKPIKDFQDYYVSNLGNIRGKKTIQLSPTKNNKGYLVINLYKNGIKKQMSVHRLVADAFNSQKRDDQNTVDHRDLNRTNNGLSNLRWANSAEQSRNRNLQKNNTTGFRGVYCRKKKKTNTYNACIKMNGKLKSLGYFPTAEEASKVYEAKAKEIHGEFYRPIFNNCTITINNNYSIN